uniref:SH3 domain-containing protein n=1 Tax=Panagrolaimus sp. ES5 TaxID=591445 RepID=A0AC34EZY3_9BILA
MFEIPAPLSSSYTPVKPHADIDLQEREKFWKEQQAEEEQRRRDEVKKNEEKSKLFQMERKQLESKLHETHLNTAKSPPSTPSAKPQPPSSQQQKKSALISGRTQMFEQRAQELADTKPVAKPKNFKFEVAVTKPLGKGGNKENGTTSSSGTSSVNGGSTEHIDSTPAKSTAEIRKQFADGTLISPTSSSPKSSISSPPPSYTNGNNGNDMPSPPPLPTSPPPPTNRVIALWDYQANEGNEISFDPDDIITEVEKVHDGWWKGRAPNGQFGLFPSNFVKPL